MAEIVQVWGKRLAEIRDKYNIKQADFAKMIGKGETHVSRWERGVSGKKGVPVDLRVAMEDIFTHEEIIYIKTGNVTEENSVVKEPGLQYEKTDQVSIPYHKEVYASAGGGSDNHSMANTTPLTFSKMFLNTYFGIYNLTGLSIINAAGDSMDPTIKSGELMFVSPMENEEFKDGGIYVLMCANVLLVKRVSYDPLTKEYTLKSDNGKVAPVKLTIDESNDCRFVGRVVGHLDRV